MAALCLEEKMLSTVCMEPCVGWLKARPVRSPWREVEKDAVRVGFLAFSIKGRT